MNNFYIKSLLKILFNVLILLSLASPISADTIQIDAGKLVPKVGVSVSPAAGSFSEGATFEVPIIVNTKGSSVNGVEIRLNYDKDRLSIISSSNGVSIIGVWVEPPKYDNSRGTASYVGVVPSGITTDSGVVGTITFKAVKSGRAIVSIGQNSRVLLNDGLGTDAILELRRAEYNILPKAPEGVNIYSETHPFQSSWYNNNSPVISWDMEPGVSGFRYVLDSKPNTIPESEVNTSETTKFFEDLDDGLWYFHIKSNKRGVWGTTGHFLVRIDTTPPADFKPEVNYLLASAIVFERAFVSFFTTDNLSGIDHYEVGVVDKSQPATESPVFVQAESPFQIPLTNKGELRVIVRAIDKAGNIRDASIDIAYPSVLNGFVTKYLNYILLALISAGFIGFIFHFIFGHHILAKVRRFKEFIKREDIDNKKDGGSNPPPYTLS